MKKIILSISAIALVSGGILFAYLNNGKNSDCCERNEVCCKTASSCCTKAK